MANTVPPIPYKQTVIKDNGYVNDSWAKFFLELFSRVGGANGDFSAQINTALEAYVDSENLALLARVEDLQKGPVL